MGKSIKLITNYLVGPVLFILLSWSLYRQLINQPDLSLKWLEIKSSWKSGTFWLVVLLMLVNWGIESRKWQLLISTIEKFTFYRAFKSVLSGCSVTMLTPNRIGEFGGRILYVNADNRLDAVSLTIIGSISQLLITVLVGTAGLIVMRYYPPFMHPGLERLPWILGSVILYISILFSIILVMLYLRVSWLIQLAARWPISKEFVKHVRVIDSLGGKQLLRILFLSFVRYLIFILQYVLLIQVMDVEIPWLVCFWLLTVFYLLITGLPTIGLSELPVRASISVELFSSYTTNVLGIQAAAFGIWLINLAVPALIGSLFIFGVKILKER